MLHQHSGSYFEDYKRQKGVRGGALENDRLLTDRSAYISFLEVQLERVSSACMTTQGFSDRIEGLQGDLLNLESKTANVARAVKLVQQLTESVGDEAGRRTKEGAEGQQQLGATVGAMAEECQRFGERLVSLEDSVRIGAAAQKSEEVARHRAATDRIGRLEAQVEQLLSHHRSYETRAAAQTDAHRADVTQELRELEARHSAKAEEAARQHSEHGARVGKRDETRREEGLEELRAELGLAEKRMATAAARQSGLVQEQLGSLQQEREAMANSRGLVDPADMQRLQQQVTRLAQTNEQRATAAEDRARQANAALDAGIAGLRQQLGEQQAAARDAGAQGELAMSKLAEEADEKARRQADRIGSALEKFEGKVRGSLAALPAQSRELERKLRTDLAAKVTPLEEELALARHRQDDLERELGDAAEERRALQETLSFRRAEEDAAKKSEGAAMRSDLLAQLREVQGALEARVDHRVSRELGDFTERDAPRRAALEAAQREAAAQIETGLGKVDRFLELYEGTHTELRERLEENRATQQRVEALLESGAPATSPRKQQPPARSSSSSSNSSSFHSALQEVASIAGGGGGGVGVGVGGGGVGGGGSGVGGGAGSAAGAGSASARRAPASSARRSTGGGSGGAGGGGNSAKQAERRKRLKELYTELNTLSAFHAE